MKLNKKKVLSLALAVCLIAILSMGSLAWFTDSDSVTNDFLIAGSDGDADKVFSIDVWEITPNGTRTDVGHEYKNILPYDLLDKEVHVGNTGSYDQYIRLTVVITEAANWLEVFGTNENVLPDISQFVEGLHTEYWKTYAHYDKTNDCLYYSMYWIGTDCTVGGDDDKVAPNADIIVFEDVRIPAAMTVAQAAKFDDGFNIIVYGQAVQTRNVGANAEAAFTTVNLSEEAAYQAALATLNP